MGAAERPGHVADAACGSSAGSHASRSHLIARFGRDRNGSTAVEYAMVAAGIALVIVSAVNVLGQNVYTMFFAKVAAAM